MASKIFVAGAYVRVVTEDSQMLRELIIDPAAITSPLEGLDFSAMT